MFRILISMVIRHAKIEDIEKIKELADSLKYNPENPKSNSIISTFNRDEYIFRINNSRFFYVDSNGDELNGFLIAHEGNLIKTLSEEGMFHHEEMLPFLSQQKEPFVYGESIGIREGMQRKGIGDALMSRWFEDIERAQIKDVYVMIRHEPHRNIHSIDFCKKYGFSFTGVEVSNKSFVHGVYKK